MESKANSWIRGSLLGRGSFGTVSLAFDGRLFAVKSVSLASGGSASVDFLENEIRILESLSSPFVVEYLGDDTTVEAGAGACRNLHLEYLPGGTAADLGGCADESSVRAYARCVARALRYLHDVAGVVHCDVKGRNVLLGEAPGVAKLADFGSAMRISDVFSGDRRSLRGTPLWMAPEVARGEIPRPESDVWSFGCTVIEMVTGLAPWSSWKPQDVAEATFRIGYGAELPEYPSHLSKLGRDFLDKCLRKNPNERWTAEQLLQHPFLAEAEPPTEHTPRGVLEWANLQLDDDNKDDTDGDFDSVCLISEGIGRVRELASSGSPPAAWNIDGWEQVRNPKELAVDECGREVEQEKCCEHYNWEIPRISCSVSSLLCSWSRFVRCNPSRCNEITVNRQLHVFSFGLESSLESMQSMLASS
ncbi:mitogen-activated protein kinase kinase kinase 18-like [Curcuma longa]|uniref:mitogen-activated protein kinase kinase kinase 18-like n=1 Tax=Curcuma longa TaxID=136217 RepID=UPI003D9F8CB8